MAAIPLIIPSLRIGITDGYSAIRCCDIPTRISDPPARADAALQELAKGLGLYYQAGKVIQVYLNGQYWGHYNLRERANRESLAQWEGITDPEIIDGVDIFRKPPACWMNMWCTAAMRSGKRWWTFAKRTI